MKTCTALLSPRSRRSRAGLCRLNPHPDLGLEAEFCDKRFAVGENLRPRPISGEWQQKAPKESLDCCTRCFFKLTKLLRTLLPHIKPPNGRFRSPKQTHRRETEQFTNVPCFTLLETQTVAALCFAHNGLGDSGAALGPSEITKQWRTKAVTDFDCCCQTSGASRPVWLCCQASKTRLIL